MRSGDALSGLGAKVGFVNGSAPAPPASNQGCRALVSGALAAVEKVITRTRCEQPNLAARINEPTRRKQS